LARKKCKGTPLKVFSGKQATLNRIILLMLRASKNPLSKYDVFLEINRIKDFKHMDSRTVYRRMEALEQESWVDQKGSRPAKPGWPSELYEITLKGKAALKLDEKNIEDFLKTATGEQLQKFIEAIS
jgi:DNA-binding PadR family transcriptional regulator